jgi:hypothetical protein
VRQGLLQAESVPVEDIRAGSAGKDQLVAGDQRLQLRARAAARQSGLVNAELAAIRGTVGGDGS